MSDIHSSETHQRLFGPKQSYTLPEQRIVPSTFLYFEVFHINSLRVDVTVVSKRGCDPTRRPPVYVSDAVTRWCYR